ncbi:MAG: NAD(P)-dependent oxidoreductase [Acidobacteria bacterium]|nr:NAD(P)-dependent oxidoreductase [Acidobacteriota bacterium]
MRIAVVGARGQLGAAVAHVAGARHEVVAFDRTSLDLTNEAAVADALGAAVPDVIVNCAGYNAVDACESNAVQALQVNAFAVRSLARVARATGAALVQYSTDFVFEGTATSPMTEDVPPNPRSVYASSKLLGEWFAADVPRHYVLRVESLFGVAPGGPDKGSLTAIVNGLRSGSVVRVFGDRTVSPTHIEDAVGATLALLERDAEPGLYHCVNSGSASWHEIALEAARLLGVTASIEVMTLDAVKLPAARPRYCALSNAKLNAAIGYDMPTWQNALGRYLNR